MKTDEVKTLAQAIRELNESHVDLIQATTDTTKEVKATKKLWRNGSNSRLIKVGLALIAFPEPAISDVIGTALVAAGTVQMGLRRRALYVEDIYKTFHNALKEVWTTRHSL